MTEENKPDIVYVRASEAQIITFHSDGKITLADKYRDQPDEAARLFLEYTRDRWLRLTRPDGWIGRVKDGSVGPAVVCVDPIDRIGWEATGYEFRPFKYTDE